MARILSDSERKAKEEKKNDLITRAEEIVATSKEEKRELTEDEMQELAEIRDDVKKIKAALGLDDDMRELSDAEAKPDAEPKEEEEKEVVTEEKTQEQRAIDEEAMFDAYPLPQPPLLVRTLRPLGHLCDGRSER